METDSQIIKNNFFLNKIKRLDLKRTLLLHKIPLRANSWSKIIKFLII